LARQSATFFALDFALRAIHHPASPLWGAPYPTGYALPHRVRPSEPCPVGHPVASTGTLVPCGGVPYKTVSLGGTPRGRQPPQGLTPGTAPHPPRGEPKRPPRRQGVPLRAGRSEPCPVGLPHRGPLPGVLAWGAPQGRAKPGALSRGFCRVTPHPHHSPNPRVEEVGRPFNIFNRQETINNLQNVDAKRGSPAGTAALPAFCR